MTEEELLYIQELTNRIKQCESTNQVLVQSVQTIINAFDSLNLDMKLLQSNIKYEILDLVQKNELINIPKIKSCEETIKEVLENKKSICRFGDGEFACISGNLRAKFTTKYYPKLAERLVEVLNSDEDGLLIALADNYGSLDKYSEQSVREIRHYMTEEVRREHNELLNKDREYYNAYITRPYVLWKDSDKNAAARFQELKQIWDKKDCVIIEGNQTRMGVGNDLFNNTASIKRIIAPAIDAFEKYEEILDAALKQSKDAIYILALGPVATVLAYDLYKSGRQALDMGHVDLEYEWFLQGKGVRQAVPTKFNNEFDGGAGVIDIHDEVYEGQIVDRV